jgi:esterase
MEQLFYRELGKENSQSLIILHGLFGSSDNWLTLGKRFAQYFHVFIIDQRNHGQSFQSKDFNYKLMADDLVDFFIEKKLNSAHILGHSMGGKTAMEFAINNAQLVDRLIIGDIGPKAYAPHHQTILKGLFSINLLTLQSRKEADEILSNFIPEIGTRQFLLKNLTRKSGGFEWKINLDGIAKNIEEVGQGINQNSHFSGPCLFIRGGNSDYILDGDFNQIHSIFKNSKIETISNTGHWLHAEQPEQFLTLSMEFLNNQL